MLFVFDIGNTTITVGGYEGKDLRFEARLASDARRTGDQYAGDLAAVFGVHGVTPTETDNGIICSVVPELTKAVSHAFAALIGHEPLVVGPGVKTGLNIKIDSPAQLGADLAVGAVGALAKYPLPCLIVDLGTATTLFVLDAAGVFRGGVIAAGIYSTLDALTSHTAQLPSVTVEAPKKVIGTNTADCMKAGLVVGAAAMIDGLCDRMEEELGTPFATVVATGGLAHEVVPLCKRTVVTDDRLILDALRLIYEKNN